MKLVLTSLVRFKKCDINYKLSVISQQGCKIIKNVFVRLYSEPNVVNAFSPNNDNRNDYWDLKALKAYGNFNYKIFDRYGVVVHQGNENSSPWDGKRSGQLLAVGTYYYIIEIHNYKKITGSITLLR